MFFRIVLFTVLLCFLNSTMAQETYTYQGNSFDRFNPPFTANSQITGSINVANFLPSNQSLDLTNANLSYSFTDGQNTRDQSNSILCQFDVQTDSNGRISSWSIYIRQSDTAPTENQHVIELFSDSPVEELSGLDVNQGGVGCDLTFALGSSGSSNMAPLNAWSGGPPTEVQSVPTLSLYMLILLSLAVMLFSFRFIKN